MITTKVKTAIFSDSTLMVNEINVETFNGVVQGAEGPDSLGLHGSRGGPACTS